LRAWFLVRPWCLVRSWSLVLDFTLTATCFVTAIGAPFQKYDDILGHREHKDTEKNTLQVARSTRRRAAAGEACQPQTNDHGPSGSVVRLRFARLTARPACRPTASSASVSQCLRGLSKSIRRRNYEILYLVSRSPDRRRRDAVPAGVAGLSVVPWQRVPVRPRHAAQLIDDFPVPERQLAGQLPCALQPGSIHV